jgi:hypothetical protein
MKHAKSLLAKIGVRAFEETAFYLDTFRVPILEKKQLRLVYASFGMANRIARAVGQPPKAYKRNVRRGVVEVILP